MTTAERTIIFFLAILCGVRVADCFGIGIRQRATAASEGVVALRMGASDDAKQLQEKAELLRKEISSFEQNKVDATRREKAAVQKEQAKKQEKRNRYSAEIPIFKQDGSTVVERVDFPPRHKDGSSYIDVAEAFLPLGMIFGESEVFPGAVCVDELAEGSNAEAAGVQVGDLLRACTACQTIMDTPAWQILAGGIGMPKTKRYMYSIDGRPFEEVMEALSSNRMDPEQRPVVLVLEKRND
uniref:PDZ domain-containing protein n=1 Tax=Grammatophora oceanica TaxID=210454 RepID=A0A7S1V1G7_9STRA|mmetsp:Transcript_30963/g.45916  ORF Transcript_30963/g.45916 Transcript_30963/m.45916 type:complete len:240 (+) Transcript_30963:93-812(+)|eukprot:CAMPEP_0194048022 /NCGR_PEP_ID=MMETSP0009_2-20130614/26570_1 /TAXON_ID=210454 /ORGANISM="Grammatophora oceanica, Strain CCMP 410" /LENGTH=239 /DNA_ID=CAMNT_0038693805 /DNA_START=22 /DNA_END=741 /DNA_ORIENTATION=+